MIVAILAFLLAWPIAIALVLTVLVLVFLANEQKVVSSVIVVAAAALGIYAFIETGAPIVWQTVALWVGGYILVGFVFTVPKWYLWSQKMGRKFGVLKAEYDVQSSRLVKAGERGTAGIALHHDFSAGNGFRKGFMEEWNTNHSKGVMNVAQAGGGTWEVSYNKPQLVGYLTSWVLNWPFYTLLLICEDLIIELMNWFADHIGMMFRNIATKAFNANIKVAETPTNTGTSC